MKRPLLVLVVSAVLLCCTAVHGHAAPSGVRIEILAENLSTSDTPFCGVGGGNVGDTLEVKAFMRSSNGLVTGTAKFRDAFGNVTTFPIDSLFGFESGIAVQRAFTGAGETVAIWMGGHLPAPALVNVEIPRGCENTISTFTSGIDEVNVTITMSDG